MSEWPQIVKEINLPNGDVRGEWSCGCTTTRIGDKFIIAPCSLKCPVYLQTIKSSKERGNAIQFKVST